MRRFAAETYLVKCELQRLISRSRRLRRLMWLGVAAALAFVAFILIWR